MNARHARHHFSDRDRVQRHRKRILDNFRSSSYSAIIASVNHSGFRLTDSDAIFIARCFSSCGPQSDEHQRIHAARTPSAKKKGPNRQGAKAVKKSERVSGTGDLNPTEATIFRALSARANYLAQDRPDLAFSTKELCREFAVPNQASYQKLKKGNSLPCWLASIGICLWLARHAITPRRIYRQ